MTRDDSVAVFATNSSWPATALANAFTFDLGDLYVSEPNPVLLEQCAEARAVTTKSVGP
ncbi:hypothetical protein [Gemmatimonas sp.]|uniref:hypothetical protein n=1 Tax=Gemmatimonas sp. TaxID=1962908 RepID=UPI00398325C6